MSLRIFHKSKEEIAKLRAVNLIVSAVLDAVEAACKPGASTMDLNDIADEKLQSMGATSAFLGYHGYPAVLCTSVNEVVVHGIPRKDVVLKDGDIIGIDFGCFKDGFCGDSARTIAIGNAVTDEARALMAATKKSLELAIEQCKPGNRLQDIGWAVQSHVEPLGYSVVRTFVGHGIGRAMHEDPPVPNYGSPGKGLRLKPGWVLAIEPMVNAGTHEVEVLADGWTAVTKDRKLSAHFEHSVAITEEGPFVLSRS
jgi:methionyl aminopeptidase